MNKYTLKPIARLLRQQPKENYTHNDLLQLLRPPPSTKNAPAPATQKIYTAALKDLIAHCPPGQSLPRAEVITLVDRFIRRWALHFHMQANKCAHENCFEPLARKRGEQYDLTFYHPGSVFNTNAHHQRGQNIHHRTQKITAQGDFIPEGFPPQEMTSENQKDCSPGKSSSVFYFRCEEYSENMLIGNMQIDATGEEWVVKDYQATLGKHTNIFKAMVQEAVKWSLARNCQKIVFQAGYANHLAQWGSSHDNFTGCELITKENITAHQKNYDAWQAQLAALNPGDTIYCVNKKIKTQHKKYMVASQDHEGLKCREETPLLMLAHVLTYHEDFHPNFPTMVPDGNVYQELDKKTPAEWTPRMKRLADLNYAPNSFVEDLLYTIISRNTYHWKLWDNKSLALISQHVEHTKLYADLIWAYTLEEPAALLTALNKIFSAVVAVEDPGPREQQIIYLKNLLKTAPKFTLTSPEPARVEFPDIYQILEPFLHEFNYHKLLLKNFPALATTADGLLYYPKQEPKQFPVLQPPVVGEISPEIVTGKMLPEPYYPIHPRSKLYNWYENTLRQIFRELKFEVKRTQLASIKVRPHYGQAYGWEIITPKEELQRRQLISL